MLTRRSSPPGIASACPQSRSRKAGSARSPGAIDHPSRGTLGGEGFEPIQAAGRGQHGHPPVVDELADQLPSQPRGGAGDHGVTYRSAVRVDVPPVGTMDVESQSLTPPGPRLDKSANSAPGGGPRRHRAGANGPRGDGRLGAEPPGRLAAMPGPAELRMKRPGPSRPLKGYTGLWGPLAASWELCPSAWEYPDHGHRPVRSASPR